MKEFWIFREDGSSYIEDAIDIKDIYTPNNSIIIDNNKTQIKSLSLEEENYYEQFFEKDKEDIILKKINKLIENQNVLSIWDKKFVFGFKKFLNNNCNISIKQKIILDNIYIKVHRSCA